MILYFLDHNRYYTGTHQEVPSTDPIPLNCVVDIAPPALTTGQYAEWTGHEWSITTVSSEQYSTIKLQAYQAQHANNQAELAKLTPVVHDDFINWHEIRIQRNILLSQSDYTQMPDYNGSKKTEWATYRQALRDLPNTYSTANMVSQITWPTPPSA